MKRVVTLAIMATMVTACSFRPPPPSTLSDEFSFYQTRCGSCHEPVAPELHYNYQWERLLTLIERALDRDHQKMQPQLTTQDKTRLLKYLKTYSLTDVADTPKL